MQRFAAPLGELDVGILAASFGRGLEIFGLVFELAKQRVPHYVEHVDVPVGPLDTGRELDASLLHSLSDQLREAVVQLLRPARFFGQVESVDGLDERRDEGRLLAARRAVVGDGVAFTRRGGGGGGSDVASGVVSVFLPLLVFRCLDGFGAHKQLAHQLADCRDGFPDRGLTSVESVAGISASIAATCTLVATPTTTTTTTTTAATTKRSLGIDERVVRGQLRQLL